MSRINSPQNTCIFDKEYSHNGTKYREDIDIAIVNQLDSCESLYSSELKRRIEQSLDQKISWRVYRDHIKMMLQENILSEEDSRERGKICVYYATTDDAKKLNQLRLLRTDPKHNLFKQIYAYLLFCNIHHPSCFSTIDFSTIDLDKLLSDINATRNDLIIECIKKHEKEAFEIMTTDPDLKPLPYSIMIEYKPIFQVRISKVIDYSMNYKNNEYVISTSYHYVLPGFSPGDFDYYAYKPSSEDLHDAFILLWKHGLVKPLMTFQCDTRYVWTDEKLNELIQNLRLFYELDGNSFYFRCYFSDQPTYQEQQKLKFFSGKLASRSYLTKTELARCDLKKRTNEQKRTCIGKSFEKQEIDREIDRHKRKIDYIKELLNEAYGETIKKYPFIHEIIWLVGMS